MAAAVIAFLEALEMYHFIEKKRRKVFLQNKKSVPFASASASTLLRDFHIASIRFLMYIQIVTLPWLFTFTMFTNTKEMNFAPHLSMYSPCYYSPPSAWI